MNETTFELTGLTCANCAQKIEDEVGRLNGVHSAKLSFAAQKLDIVFSHEISPEALEDEVRKTVTGIESGVEVLTAEDAVDRKKGSRIAFQG